MSWKKDTGYFERTPDMVFALERRIVRSNIARNNNIAGKKTKQFPVIRGK